MHILFNDNYGQANPEQTNKMLVLRQQGIIVGEI